MEVVPNIYKVELPLPSKIDHINCYLLRNKNGWSIIDTGLSYQTSARIWEGTFAEMGINYGDIEGIFITHLHSCHYGASGWLQELTGAPVYMSRTEIANVDQTWKKGRTNMPVVGELLKENGMPPDLIPEVLDDMSRACNSIQPHPSLYPVTGGDTVELAGRSFRIIYTPGHSDGHIILFNEDEGILISGDQLLAVTYSSICLWPTSHPNPLDLFLSSLETIGKLPVKLVLPAHGPVFTDCAGRLDDLFAYYHNRLARVEELAGVGTTAYQICARLYGADRPLNQICFVLTETLALLAYLESRSRVASRLESGMVTYKKV